MVSSTAHPRRSGANSRGQPGLSSALVSPPSWASGTDRSIDALTKQVGMAVMPRIGDYLIPRRNHLTLGGH